MQSVTLTGVNILLFRISPAKTEIPKASPEQVTVPPVRSSALCTDQRGSLAGLRSGFHLLAFLFRTKPLAFSPEEAWKLELVGGEVS